MKKLMLMFAIGCLLIGSVNATIFKTKVGFELSDLSGVSQLGNSDGNSIKITIHQSNGSVVESRFAEADVFTTGETVVMNGSKFYLSHGTQYIYNLSTDYGAFYYNFTTPGLGQAELHSGLTTSYGTADDDADYDGTPASYTDNGCGTGTVLDDHTGLCWQKDDQSGKTWENAKSYCNSLNLSGHDDWRLPSVVEGLTMLDYECSGASTNCVAAFRSTAFNWDDCGGGCGAWTGTIRQDSTDLAYAFFASYGSMKASYKTNAYNVRCVRQG